MTELLGPVSAVLERDLRDWVSRHGLVIWLDADNHYTGFVDRLIELRQEDKLKFDIYKFRGSHLELMLELENVTGGIDTTRVVIHLPGFNEELVRISPLFELYRAGKRYRKAIETVIRDAAAGQVRPDQIEQFLSRERVELADADLWLGDLTTTGAEGLASQLRNASLNELVDDLLLNGSLAQRISAIDLRADTATSQAIEASTDQRAIRDRLVALTGMPESWFDDSLRTSFSSGAQQTSAEAVAYAICSWAACVSYVHDLLVPPRSLLLQPVPQLPTQVRDVCHQLVVHLQHGNERQRSFYRQMALETESRLTSDAGQIAAKDLGRFDTFYFEEETILKDSLRALQHGQWKAAQDWAIRRSDPNAFWLRDDAPRRNVWQLVDCAARLGLAIDDAGPTILTTESLEAAVDTYTRFGAKVDQAHRLLEQNRQKLLRSQMPEFVDVRAALDHMQMVWRDWANTWARDFNRICTAHGFLPDTSRQQRYLFDEEVKPLVSLDGITAYFVIDAFRYEMAIELLEAVKETAQTHAKLGWRLAELPSVTEVGMNVLAPVAKAGRLQPELLDDRIAGFSTGEFRVFDRETRKRAMHDRVGGDTCPWLDLSEVLRRDSKSLARAIARSKLLVVHSREIDNAGEEGLGPAVFETVMKDLRSAWHLLREAGVRHFVFTADHGFLLLDEASNSVQAHGRKVDPKRRHIISDRPANHSGEVRVSMKELGYDCDDAYVMFPETVAVFDTGKRRAGFAHGGNSFQERVIPVLTISHRIMTGGSTTSYDVAAVKKAPLAGMQRLAGKVAYSQGGLDFGSSFEIDLAISVPDAPGVRVELCEIRGGARLASGAVVASVGEEFELFFRLAGNTTSRVQIELYHPSKVANVTSCLLKERFDVLRSPENLEKPIGPDALPDSQHWLRDLPEGSVRSVFLHISTYGTITEAEVADLLGSPREQRKFARNFERFAASAPFATRIDVVSGVKRYVREGASS